MLIKIPICLKCLFYSLSKFNVDQELISNLSKHLLEKECLINELVLDGINLKNINYVCCLTPNTKYLYQ